MDDNLIYGVVIIAGVALLVFSLLSALAPPAAAQGQPPGYQPPALSGTAVPPECGDINDPANLQHLSHHPDRFQACYRVVDPAKFKAATGQDVSSFIR